MAIEILKQCRTCGEVKDREHDFTWRAADNGRRYPYADCKLCRQDAMNERYATDPAYRAACDARNRKSREKRRHER